MIDGQPALIDTHCHLDAAEFALDRDMVVAAANAAGVTQIVIPAVEVANFEMVRACCQRYPACLPAYGIHPMYTGQASPEDLVTLRQWLLSERDAPQAPLAIGEIGLDFFVPDFDAARQTFFFAEQLKIAREFGLPVLLHGRRALDAVLAQLRRHRVPGGIMHAFNGSRQQADAFIALGFKLGFGGALTWERALRIRSLAQTLPIEAIVLETDAPDMPPAFAPAQRNTPANLPRIAALLAELRGISLPDLLAASTRNARSVLPGLAQGKTQHPEHRR